MNGVLFVLISLLKKVPLETIFYAVLAVFGMLGIGYLISNLFKKEKIKTAEEFLSERIMPVKNPPKDEPPFDPYKKERELIRNPKNQIISRRKLLDKFVHGIDCEKIEELIINNQQELAVQYTLPFFNSSLEDQREIYAMIAMDVINKNISPYYQYQIEFLILNTPHDELVKKIQKTYTRKMHTLNLKEFKFLLKLGIFPDKKDIFTLFTLSQFNHLKEAYDMGCELDYPITESSYHFLIVLNVHTEDKSVIEVRKDIPSHLLGKPMIEVIDGM